MKIAVASEKELVTEHFGHCENFNIFHVQDNKIVKVESIPNPGHVPGYLPNFLNDMGVNIIVSGGMGGGAVKIFKEKGIEVITGVKGTAKDIVTDYLDGKLEATNEICDDHK